MAIELKVPQVGESITEVQIGQWLKNEGEPVDKDENLVEIETDKATLEIAAPQAGTISKVLKRTGDVAAVGEVIGYLEPSGDGRAAAAIESQAGQDAEPDEETTAAVQQQAVDAIGTSPKAKSSARKSAQQTSRPTSDDGPDGAVSKSDRAAPAKESPQRKPHAPGGQPRRSDKPAARENEEAGGDSSEDRSLVISAEIPRPIPRMRELPRAQPRSPAAQIATSSAPARGDREEEVVPMSPIRRRIAERLVEAQHTAALLTTFNEIDMSAVIALRNEHKQLFADKYGIKLGFMSFFVKAAIDALKHVPAVNAEIRDKSIVYHNYFDIGIAVGGGKGLVVPVLRDADRLSFAEIELTIADFAHRARENSLQLDELQGGTFTISNGGVYGSMLSTPIVNPPQSGILGLHAIGDRPVARDGQVVIRPIMYVALTYDHRVVDGQGAVTFLKRVKEVIEEPMRMLVEV